MKKRTIFAAIAAILIAGAVAKATAWYDAGGAGTINAVMHYLGGSNVATPVSSTNPLPVNVVSGGGGGGTFTWPGSATVTNYGTAPTGTVPAVNAYVTNPLTVSNNAVGPASGAATQASISTTSAAAALPARTGASGTGRVSVTIYNSGSATAYVGYSTGVTTSTGIPILPGGSYTKRTTAALYAITASGTTTLAFDEEF